MSRRAAFVIVGAVVSIVAGVVSGDAQRDYAAIFGKEAARVAASGSKADDVTFAKKLLESAAAVSESPKLQVLLYEKALQFAGTSSEGLPTAFRALDLLERKFPDRKADWQARRLALLRGQYTRARGEAKKTAALTYLDALMAAADALMSAAQPQQAIAHYRSARNVATYYRKEMLPETRRKITQATNAAIVAGKIKALRSRLKADPKDTPAREGLIVLYVVQQDAPSKAREVITDSVNEGLRAHVRLAGRSAAGLSEGDCLRLGDWYYKTLLPKASGRGRRIVLERAEGYYEQYLTRHALKDVSRYQAGEALSKVKTELARLGPRRLTAPATKVPKDAVAFGGHHYKTVMANHISWQDAVKECKKLGGHLVTAESAQEMALLRKLSGRNRLWVGATDQAAEGKWIWVDGKSFSRALRLWASGEPNEGRQCNYASVVSDGLRDTPSPGTRVVGFICEWDH